MKILITGARAPVALELVRNFRQNGHIVYVTDSCSIAMTRGSRFVKKYYTLPSPRYNEKEFVRTISEIIVSEEIDVLVPTCEEAFWISKNKQAIQSASRFLRIDVDNFDVMQQLHDKSTCMILAQSLGVPTPRGLLVNEKADLQQLKTLGVKKIILKPIFSRFGGYAVMPNDPDTLGTLFRHGDAPYIVQEYVEGVLLCVYAYAQNGDVRFCVAYEDPTSLPGMPLTVFRAINQPIVKSYVAKIVKATNYSGHISFDFIINADKCVIIECNPRVTSGVHLLVNNDIYELCYGGSSGDVVVKNSQLLVPSLLRRHTQPLQYMKTIPHHRDVIFQFVDPFPLLWACVSAGRFYIVSKKEKVTLTDAMTIDIQWDGDK